MSSTVNKGLRDMPIAITDLLLAGVAVLMAQHASPGLQYSGKEADFPAIAMLEIALCAFLGFLHWGLIPTNNQLHKVYRFFISLTKFVSVPYLLAALVQQNHVTQLTLFTIFHATFVLLEFVLVNNAQVQRNYDVISQVLSVGPLVLLVVQGVLNQNLLQLAVVVGFAGVAATTKNIPVFHVVMCAVLWLIESTRSGALIKSL